MRPRSESAPNWVHRLGWMILIWLASVLALGIVAMLFRVLMRAAGLTI
jgi:hypothetical protein